MGCTSSKNSRRTLSSSIVMKICPMMQKTPSTLDFSKTVAVGNRTEKCFKIKLFSHDEGLLKSSLMLSMTSVSIHTFNYAAEYNLIKETWAVFISAVRNFFSLAHDVCISNFRAHDSLFILLISILANKSAEVKFFQSFPYFSIKGELRPETLQFLDAWKTFMTVLDSILVQKTEKVLKAAFKLEELCKLLAPSLARELRTRNIAKVIQRAEHACKTGRRLVEQSLKFKSEILRFFSNPHETQPEISKLAESAQKLTAYTGERIVHLVLS